MNGPNNLDSFGSYRSFIVARMQQCPCLQRLLAFLRKGGSSKYGCRIVCLEFSSSTTLPCRRSLDLNGLIATLSDTEKESGNISGRLLIIEDLSSCMIEILGSLLNIDPLYFASHLDTFGDDIGTTRPSTVVLPSTMISQNFLNLQCHRVIELELGNLDPGCELYRDINVPRKVALLPRTKGRILGLARHCCSMLKTESKDGLWLGGCSSICRQDSEKMAEISVGLMLVDPPISNSYVSQYHGDPVMHHLSTRLFQGGFQGFLTFSDDACPGPGPSRSSPLDSLISFWRVQNSPGFDVKSPTLLSLSSYPLRMIAAEWTLYVELMYHSIKSYEYSSENTLAALGQITNLSADIQSLSKWARRCIASKNKIRYVLEYLEHRAAIDKEDVIHTVMLIRDYNHIATGIDTYGQRLEALVPIATSLIQAIDCRRSLVETANISRLTYLALSFIPLTFVSGLFGMNVDILPAGKVLGLYFAVAIPLCVVVFLFAHLPRNLCGVFATRNEKSKDLK